MKRYLISHSRGLGTFDLIEEGGVLGVERCCRGRRMRMSVEEFEMSPHGAQFRTKLRSCLARAQMDQAPMNSGEDRSPPSTPAHAQQ
jgi:hypothetical protein